MANKKAGKTGHACSKPVDGHIDLVGKVLVDAGINMADTCEQTYQALLEVAEFSRLLHGFEPYTPVKAATLAESFQELEAAAARGDKEAVKAAIRKAHGSYTSEEQIERVAQMSMETVGSTTGDPSLDAALRDFNRMLERMGESQAAQQIGAPLRSASKKRTYDD